MSGISKSQVSKLCQEIDERVGAFLGRRIEGEWPYLWLDATYLKVRDGGRVVSIAAIIATAVNQDGRREIIGLGLGPSEAATFWLGFLRDLHKRRLTGVRLVISDAHEGLKAAIAQIFKAPWQRCRVHFMRNCLAYVPKGQHSMVAAAIRTVFTQEDAAAGATAWRHVADQLRPRFPKLAALMDDAETDFLAFMSFPRAHWPKLHSTNPRCRVPGLVAAPTWHLRAHGRSPRSHGHVPPMARSGRPDCVAMAVVSADTLSLWTRRRAHDRIM
jgi:putative transposase